MLAIPATCSGMTSSWSSFVFSLFSVGVSWAQCCDLGGPPQPKQSPRPSRPEMLKKSEQSLPEKSEKTLERFQNDSFQTSDCLIFLGESLFGLLGHVRPGGPEDPCEFASPVKASGHGDS